MKRATTMLMAVGAMAIAAQAIGQPARPARAPAIAPAPVDSKIVISEVRRILAENYVLPEMRPKLDAAFAKGLAAGRYDVADPRELAERINADLAATAHDRHLNFHYAPEQAARLAASKPEADDAPADADQIRRAQARNHGLAEMKVLPGNVRYLDVDGFVWVGPKTAEAYDVAMRFLRDGDAVIIDLRRNGGGSPEAVQYLVSHFLEPNRPLVTFYMGKAKPDPRSTLAQLPAGRMVGKPLYVLTSGRTASAAEEFAAHVAGFRLGELIGANTAGGGFRNSFFPVPGGFVMSVSVGRAVLASTGKDWEGIGVAPTTAVDISKALEVAQVHAMRRLAGTAPPREKAELEGMATVLAAQVDPVATALPLTAYAGTFGERIIRVEDGALTYQRGGGPKIRMIPVGPNLFAFDGDPLSRLEYSVSGTAAPSFDLVRGDGTRQKIDRTS